MSAEAARALETEGPPTAQPAGRVLMSGVIEDDAMVVDLLNLLSNSQRTAGFDVIDGALRRTLYLRQGDIIAASSNLPTDRLGHVAYRMGLITETQLAMALKASERGHKIGNLLIDEGLIQPADLWAAMRSQTEEILSAMVAVRSGRFLVQRFEAALLPNLNPMPTQQILLNVLRRQDELAHLRASIPEGRRPVVPKGSLPSAPTPTEARLLQAIDGHRGVDELVEVTQLGERAVLQAVKGLLTRGVIAFGEPAPPTVDWGGEILEALMALVALYNRAYTEIGRAFLDRIDQPTLSEICCGFMDQCAGEEAALFAGVQVLPEARLPLAPLVSHLKHINPPEPQARLRNGLHEYLQYLLFQAWSYLPPASVDGLIHRTELLIRER